MSRDAPLANDFIYIPDYQFVDILKVDQETMPRERISLAVAFKTTERRTKETALRRLTDGRGDCNDELFGD